MSVCRYLAEGNGNYWHPVHTRRGGGASVFHYADKTYGKTGKYPASVLFLPVRMLQARCSGSFP